MVQASASQSAGKDYFPKFSSEQVVISEKLCGLISIPAGARVLDVGGAAGHSALHAAIAAGRRHAKVTALHMKESVLQHARARAELEMIDDIEFVQGDAAAIPFPDASFDFVVSTLGAVFLPDQEATAGELARVVRPGGVIALTAFVRSSLPSRMYDLMGELIPNAPRPQRHHYDWSNGPRAGELLSPYFHDVQVRSDSYDSCYPSPAAAFDMTFGWNPNIQALIARSPPELIQQIRSGFIRIAEGVNRATDGTYMGKTDYGVITGVRAG